MFIRYVNQKLHLVQHTLRNIPTQSIHQTLVLIQKIQNNEIIRQHLNLISIQKWIPSSKHKLIFDQSIITNVDPSPPKIITYNTISKDSTTIEMGQPVRIHPTGIGIVKADISIPGGQAIGLVKTRVAPLETVEVVIKGAFTLNDWTNVTGSTTLAADSDYFLDLNGQLTQTPTIILGQLSQKIGTAVSPTTLEINPKQSILL